MQPVDATAGLGGQAKWALALWAVLCVVGVWVLASYSQSPGQAGAATRQLSSASIATLGLDDARPTLVMFLHPRCPCSVASLEQLARLQAQLPGRFATRLVFSCPDAVPAGWHEGRLWQRAASLADTQRVLDRGRALACASGAETSGTVALYEPGGALVFWGGITPSRGHTGDSLGGDALSDYFNHEQHRPASAVYGCSLFAAGERACCVKPGGACGETDKPAARTATGED